MPLADIRALIMRPRPAALFPSAGVKVYLKAKRRAGSGFAEQLRMNFHTNKEEVGEGKKHLRPDNAHAEPH